MNEGGPKIPVEATMPKEKVLADLKKRVDKISSYFSEEENGQRVMDKLTENLPDQATQQEILSMLEEMKNKAIDEKSPEAGLLLNLISAIKRG